MSSDFERLYLESNQGEPVIMSNGKVCGHIIGVKYIKQIHTDHIMLKPPAIAIDKDIFARFIQKQCDRIFILNMDSGEFYSSSVENFAKHAFYLDRHFGGQYALGMEFWGINRGVVNQCKLAI
jgi:hypothetical protein